VLVHADEARDHGAAREVEHRRVLWHLGARVRAERRDPPVRDDERLVLACRRAGAVDHAHVPQHDGGRVDGHERPHRRSERLPGLRLQCAGGAKHHESDRDPPHEQPFPARETNVRRIRQIRRIARCAGGGSRAHENGTRTAWLRVTATAELHWYEAHGIGRRMLKIKRLLDSPS